MSDEGNYQIMYSHNVERIHKEVFVQTSLNKDHCLSTFLYTILHNYILLLHNFFTLPKINLPNYLGGKSMNDMVQA